jgi:tetratricopeptide (TPR) repeat protein
MNHLEPVPPGLLPPPGGGVMGYPRDLVAPHPGGRLRGYPGAEARQRHGLEMLVFDKSSTGSVETMWWQASMGYMPSPVVGYRWRCWDQSLVPGGCPGGYVLGELAEVGGTALVGAMATDAWQATRSEVAQLFGRGGLARQAAIEAQLDGNAALVAQARDPDEVRQSLVGVWRLQLEALLGEHPDAVEELSALVAKVREALPAAQQTWVQTNIARDQATQNIVQHGTLHVHPGGDGPTGDDRASTRGLDKRYDVFLSYSRQDAEFARELASNFAGENLDVFLDTNVLAVGDDWETMLADALVRSRNAVVVVSPGSIHSRWLQSELSAMTILRAAGELRIIPVLHATVELPAPLSRYAAIDFTGLSGRERDERMRQLAAAVRGTRVESTDRKTTSSRTGKVHEEVIADEPQEEYSDQSAYSYLDSGRLAQLRGDYDRAESYYHQSLVISEELGDRAGLGASYHALGNLAQLRGDYDRAESYYHQSLVISEELGDRVRMSVSYRQLGNIAQDRGDYNQAESYYHQSLVISEELGDRVGAAAAYHNLGTIAQDKGDYDEALRYYQRSLSIKAELGDRAGIANTQSQIGGLLTVTGRADEAVPYTLSSLKARAELASPDVRNDLHWLGQQRDALGEKHLRKVLEDELGENIPLQRVLSSHWGRSAEDVRDHE